MMVRYAAMSWGCVLLVGVTSGCDVGSRRPTTRPDEDAGTSADGGGSAFRDANTPPGCDPFRSGMDQDGDGFIGGTDDCDDCSAAANPGAFDFPGNGADEDCDGSDATAAASCDTGLALDSSSADDAARAIGLCKFTTETGRDWGVISARYTNADGSDVPSSAMQHGITPTFGAFTPREGSSMLVLSSGAARAPGQPGFTSDCDLYDDDFFSFGSPHPAGFPVESPSCPGVTTGPVFDAIGLEVRVRVPSNARSLFFVSSFLTHEFPEFICSEYNDYFVTLMQPRPAGISNDNIVLDAEGNVVSVNNSLLDVCEPGSFGGKNFTCLEGAGQLAGTGFAAAESECGNEGGFSEYPNHSRAGTGWLATTAPDPPGSVITLRFTIWDSGDASLDSTVLIDSFRWEVDEAPVRTVPDLI